MLGVSLLVVHLLRPLPIVLIAPRWLSMLAALVAVAGLGLGLSALAPMRHSFRVAPAPRQDAYLVRHGVYRRLRHPMYTAVLLLVAAVSLHQPDWGVLIVAAANVVFYLAKAGYEEGLLRARYADYADYQRGTWGVIPGRGRARGE